MTTTIPNVYQALVQLADKAPLREEIQTCFRNQGWEGVVSHVFAPHGNSISGTQAGIILCVSPMAQGHLITREELIAFDSIIANAVRKWAELHKPVRAAKIITDNMGY